ncbi:MAG: hypothetical protein PHS66_01580 [Candidatus Omnitrophica bacterium]|nr:hypothetical protein [Candidatus Omnitrophota bacterium]
MDRDKSPKLVADNLYKIPILSLKLNDFLEASDFGIIDIPYNGEVFKNGIHIVVSFINKNDPFLDFYYSILQPNGEYQNFEYRVDLVATSCNYGGVRYWFKCPLSILGCDRRVGVLYRVGNYFGCRNCFDLAYESSRLSGIYKKFGVINVPELIKQAASFKRWCYKGKPTKKLIWYGKKYEKAIALTKLMNDQMNERLKKTVEDFDKFVQKERRKGNAGK